MKRKMLLGFVLTFAMGCAIAAPTFAADNCGKAMPSEVMAALNTSATTYSTLANKNTGVLDDVLMKSSLGITTPRLNDDNIHTYIPLTNSDVDMAIKKELRDHGYTEAEITNMDLGDYMNLYPTWLMDDARIEVAKEIYPELADVNLSTWTNGQYDEFVQKKVEAETAPTLSEKMALKARNITLEDAKLLTKDFGSYENVLEQSDKVLKNTLEDYYQFIYDNVAAQANLEAGIAPMADMSLYVKVASFSGYAYTNDYILSSVGTHVQTYRTQQEAMAKKEVKALYNLSSVPSSAYMTNIYGSYSQSQGGAHEGIDFAYKGNGNTATIYNMSTGVVGAPSSSHSSHHLRIYDSGTNKSYSYLHMSQKSVSQGQTLSKLKTAVGKQGMAGNATGYHVHFELHSGNTATLSAENDDKLGSISPYQMHNLPN